MRCICVSTGKPGAVSNRIKPISLDYLLLHEDKLIFTLSLVEPVYLCAFLLSSGFGYFGEACVSLRMISGGLSAWK